MHPIGVFFSHKVLRLRKGSIWAAYWTMLVVFILSGGFHYLAHCSGLAREKTGFWTFWFFPLQVVGIGIEEVVLRIGRQCGVRDSSGVRWIGRFWLLAWFTLTMPLYLDEDAGVHVMMNSNAAMFGKSGVVKHVWRFVFGNA